MKIPRASQLLEGQSSLVRSSSLTDHFYGDFLCPNEHTFSVSTIITKLITDQECLMVSRQYKK
ncbi:Hypothetical protein CINCED_3A017950 [Cinara cedri]|uniref:Uncharacterized protein n=1 Tax=Cinara cedri TaxID=506608 RepID=A0A5E4NCT8_9HEMI|nr:Hypothetical protein CINCED_3A017950 [Cinara cedri]